MPRSAILRKFGFTIPELLVAMFVSSILLIVLVQLFTVSFRIGRQELQRSATEAGLVVTLKKLEADLLSTSPAGVTLDPAGVRLVVHPILTVTNRRQVVHEDRLLYWSYDAANQEALRSELLTPLTGVFDTLAKRLSPGDLAGLPVGGTARVLSRLQGVNEFLISNPTGVTVPNVGSPIRITLSGLVEGADTRQEVRLQRSVWLRSGAN